MAIPHWPSLRELESAFLAQKPRPQQRRSLPSRTSKVIGERRGVLHSPGRRVNKHVRSDPFSLSCRPHYYGDRNQNLVWCFRHPLLVTQATPSSASTGRGSEATVLRKPAASCSMSMGWG